MPALTDELTPRGVADELLAVAEDKKAWESVVIDVLSLIHI